MQEPIRICLISDKNYIDLLKMCIYAIIITSHPEAALIFYLLGDKVDLSDLKKFEKLGNVQVITQTLDMDKIIIRNASHRYLTKTMYMRVLIPELPIFKDVDKVLYLDTDAIAKKDLSEYYNTDISGTALGVIKDFGCANVYNDKPTNLDTYHYFYSGQLLMNLPYLRKIQFTDQCLKLIHTTDLPDQQIINQVIGTQVKYLDPKYCFSWHKTILTRSNYTNIDLWNKTYGTHYKSMKDLEDASVVWHFHGDKQIQKTNKAINALFSDLSDKVNKFLGGK